MLELPLLVVRAPGIPPQAQPLLAALGLVATGELDTKAEDNHVVVIRNHNTANTIVRFHVGKESPLRGLVGHHDNRELLLGFHLGRTEVFVLHPFRDLIIIGLLPFSIVELPIHDELLRSIVRVAEPIHNQGEGCGFAFNVVHKDGLATLELPTLRALAFALTFDPLVSTVVLHVLEFDHDALFGSRMPAFLVFHGEIVPLTGASRLPDLVGKELFIAHLVGFSHLLDGSDVVMPVEDKHSQQAVVTFGIELGQLEVSDRVVEGVILHPHSHQLTTAVALALPKNCVV